MRSGVCAYCGKGAAKVEREHVFPASWHPTTTPANLSRITVPSCRRCNGEYNDVERRLLQVWATCLPADDPASVGVFDRVLRSMQPQRATNARDERVRAGTHAKLVRSIKLVPIGETGGFPGLTATAGTLTRLPSGAVAPAAPALFVRAKDVAVITEKFVRGMHFYVIGAPLAEGFVLNTFNVKESEWPWLYDKFMSRVPRIGTPPGFAAWRCAATDGSCLWFFLLWGQIFLQAAILPREVSTAPPGTTKRG